jgi:hypothetical protein
MSHAFDAVTQLVLSTRFPKKSHSDRVLNDTSEVSIDISILPSVR